MEKAILKTLIYSDIFDYPLKTYEIHKWLISKHVSLREIEKAIKRLKVKGKIKSKIGYFFLPGRQGIVKKRLVKEKQSKKFYLKVKIISTFLKIIPTLRLVGISGGLALNNASSTDDIDLFLITSKNRLWLTRFLVIAILDFLGVRRKAKMNLKKASGKICINILVEQDWVEQTKKDIYIAHEVLQMKVLWQRGNAYKKYLEDNSWVFGFLPNWVGDEIHSTFSVKWIPDSVTVILENITKKLQLKIMQKPQGLERIEEGALYFHPNDVRKKITSLYKQRVKNLSNT